MSFQKSNRFTTEQLQEFANNSVSIAQMCVYLGIKPVGANYFTVKRMIQRHNLNTEHWTGQSWSKDIQKKDWSRYTRPTHLKKHLIRERGHKCEKCEGVLWNGIPITLELEHCDGNRTNNNYDNLKLLCPNCHSQTPTWRRQKSVVGVVGVEPTV